MRNHYDDDAVARMAEIAVANQLFSGNCTGPRVLRELSGYSDFQLHCFSHNHAAWLGDFRLPPSCVMSSGKFAFMQELLDTLKAAGAWGAPSRARVCGGGGGVCGGAGRWALRGRGAHPPFALRQHLNHPLNKPPTPPDTPRHPL